MRCVQILPRLRHALSRATTSTCFEIGKYYHYYNSGSRAYVLGLMLHWRTEMLIAIATADGGRNRLL